MQKDEIIKSLESKLSESVKSVDDLKKQVSDLQNQWSAQTSRERSDFEMQIKRLGEERSVELSEKEEKIHYLEEEIHKIQRQRQLSTSKAKKSKRQPLYPGPVITEIRAAPRVERLYKAAVEVKYEQDPYIVEQNEKMVHELDIALVKYFYQEK